MLECGHPTPTVPHMAIHLAYCLQVAEEIRFRPRVWCETLDWRLTLDEADLENGDILIIQKAVSEVVIAFI